MTICIDWTFFLDVTTESKAAKILERVRGALGLPLDNVKMERYWKDERLFRAMATTCLEVLTATDGFYGIMKAVNGLARLWIVNGPTEGELWEFAGEANPGSIRIVGVEAISFSTTGGQVKSETSIAASTPSER